MVHQCSICDPPKQMVPILITHASCTTDVHMDCAPSQVTEISSSQAPFNMRGLIHCT
jgi:hypothetical protein